MRTLRRIPQCQRHLLEQFRGHDQPEQVALKKWDIGRRRRVQVALAGGEVEVAAAGLAGSAANVIHTAHHQRMLATVGDPIVNQAALAIEHSAEIKMSGDDIGAQLFEESPMGQPKPRRKKELSGSPVGRAATVT